MPKTTQWVGNATDVGHVAKITVTGSWVATETLTLTLNSANLIMTVNANMTATEVGDAIAAMINGDALTELGESRTTTGNILRQWSGISATAASGVVTMTHEVDGFPFTVSVAETSTSGGLAFAVVTQATGQNWVDNADNWDNGVPVDGDSVIVDGDETSVGLLYGLDSFTGDTWVTGSFRRAPDVGLANSLFSYETDLPERLQVCITNLYIEDSIGSTMRLDTESTGPCSMYAKDAQDVDWIGVHSSNTLFANGNTNLSIAAGIGESATVGTIKVHGGAEVYVGDTVTISTSITATENGTVIVNNSAVPAVTATASTVEILGQQTVTTATVNNGATAVFDTTGTITTVNANEQSVVTTSRDGRAKSITTLNLSRNALLNKNSVTTIGTLNIASNADRINTY